MKFIKLLLIFIIAPFALSAQDDVSSEVASLLYNLNQTASDTSKVNILNDLASEFIGVDNDKALEYCKKAVLVSNKTNYEKGLSQSYYSIAKCFYYKYEFDSILHYYDLSKKINEKK